MKDKSFELDLMINIVTRSCNREFTILFAIRFELYIYVSEFSVMNWKKSLL